jgi:hypothetical protein
MQFIPHVWVDLLVAETFGLTRTVASTPHFPKVEVQQRDINWTATAQSAPSFLKHLRVIVGCHFF